MTVCIISGSQQHECPFYLLLEFQGELSRVQHVGPTAPGDFLGFQHITDRCPMYTVERKEKGVLSSSSYLHLQ